MNLNPRGWAKTAVQALRAQRLRLRGASVGADTRLESGVAVRRGWAGPGPGRVDIGAGCHLDTGVVIDAYGGAVSLGAYVFMGPYAVIYGHGGVSIGEKCLIAMHCRILSSNHTIPPRGTDIQSQPDVLLPTRLGRDVWMGAGVTVLGGVSLGDGCIIGAGSVVTKDIPEGAIAFGSPAVVKGYREGFPSKA